MDKFTVTVFNTCTGRYEEVEVTQEVYEVYKRTWWNIEKDDQRFHKFQSTFSELIGSEGIDNFDEFVSMSKRKYEEEFFEDASEERIKLVKQALKTLRESDLKVITSIFYDNKTEEELAEALHVTHQAISKRKKRCLRKLRKKILEFYAEKGCKFETSFRYK